MAKLVMAAGVPHLPRLIYEIEQAPGTRKAEALMRQVRTYVDKTQPDVIFEVDSDHLVNFFLNNLPSFCIGMAEEATGPQEVWCPMPRYTIKGHLPLASGLLRYGINSGFDLAAAHELRPDHSLMVPLHFLNPGMELPVIPIYTNGFVSPLPMAGRCLSLGQMLRRFIDEWPGDERIALIASGGFAGDVGGPVRGWTDTEWVETITEHLERGAYAELATKATEERIFYAGNNSGEILNWLAVAGALGDAKPAYVEVDGGSGWAVWDLGV